MIPFLSQDLIRKYAHDVLWQYERVRKKPVTFPLDAADVFERLFDLPTVYDDRGFINTYLDHGIIGCLFPDGHQSPWGQDKHIVVNKTKSATFDPMPYNENFTIAHEGMGHYILHFLRGIGGDEHEYCRSEDDSSHVFSRLEWQANFAAGELTQPLEKIIWLLDGKRPPEIVNLEVYAKNYQKYFGANRKMMETRLKTLGYTLLHARYEWARLCTKSSFCTKK